MAYLLKKSCAVRAALKKPKEYRTNLQLIKQDRNEEQHKEEEDKEDNKDNENDHEDMNVDRRTIIGNPTRNLQRENQARSGAREIQNMIISQYERLEFNSSIWFLWIFVVLKNSKEATNKTIVFSHNIRNFLWHSQNISTSVWGIGYTNVSLFPNKNVNAISIWTGIDRVMRNRFIKLIAI